MGIYLIFGGYQAIKKYCFHFLFCGKFMESLWKVWKILENLWKVYGKFFIISKYAQVYFFYYCFNFCILEIFFY